MESKVDGALWLGDSETWSWKAQLYSLQPSSSNCWVARTMELVFRSRMGVGTAATWLAVICQINDTYLM